MKEVYETSSGTEEVRGSALKNTGAGRKPGDNIFVSISKAIGLFFLSQLISTVAVLGYIVFNSMNEVDDNGNVTIYISNVTRVGDSITLSTVSDDNEWTRIKNVIE